MGTRIKIDGVGTVEVDDSFQSLSPEEQQHTVEEIAGSAKANGPSTSPSAPAPAKTPRGTMATYQALERFIQSRYPQAKFTSDYRDPEHNRSVGGVEGSYHTTRQAVDMTGLDDTQRNSLKQDLINAGVQPKEFLFHDAGSGMHLHIAADRLPDSFLQQWGNHPGSNPTANVEPQGLDATNAELRRMFHAGASTQDILAYGKAHGVAPNPDQIETARKKGMDVQFVQPSKTPDTSEPEQPTGLRHDLDFYGDQIRRGVGDLIDAPANIADLVYKGGQAIPRILSGGPFIGDVKDLPLPELARPGALLNDKVDQEEQNQIGYVPEAANGPQRYAGASVRLLAGSAIPAARLAAAGKARAALAALSAAATGGVTGEAAHDVAPSLGVDPDKARLFGQVVGSVAGGSPLAAKPLADARFVGKQVRTNPHAAFDAEIAQDLKGLTTSKARSPTDPKGRSVVTAKEINALEGSYLTRFGEKIGALDIPPEQAAALKDALQQRHAIPLAELEKLRGTPAGNAVADGITKVQRLRQLTPEIKRSGRIARLAKTGLDVAGVVGGGSAGGPAGAAGGLGLARLATRVLTRNGDAEAARVHSAERVIDRAPLYKRVGDKVGPSGQRQSANALNQAALDAQASKADARAQSRQSPLDKAISDQIDAGIPGSHNATNAYARILGVGPQDVLNSLGKIDVPQAFQFEATKLRHGYNTGKAAQQVLIPRLRKALTDDGTIAARQSEPAPTASPTASKPKAAEPTVTNFDERQPAPAEATPADPEIRRVVRPSDYDRGTASYIARADAKISSIKSDPDIPNGRRDEVVNAAESVKRDHKTKESARRWVDFEYVPQLEAEGVDPHVIDHIQRQLYEVADVGKKHGTQAELDAATRRRPRGRPTKTTASDDVPF